MQCQRNPNFPHPFDILFPWIYDFTMQTTVTTKNMVTIPAELSRKMGISPGCRLEWRPMEDGGDTVSVRIIPTKKELSRRLAGRWRPFTSGRDVIAELIDERENDDLGEEAP